MTGKVSERYDLIVKPEVLRYIIMFKAENGGDSPTTREISDHIRGEFGYRVSTSMVAVILHRLVADHKIVIRTRGGKNQSIIVEGYEYRRVRDGVPNPFGDLRVP